MNFSFFRITRALALTGLFAPCTDVFAQNTLTIDGAQLQAKCNSMATTIGPVTTSFSFMNWENLEHKQDVTFVPLTASCVTNQPQWVLQFEKRSGMAPPIKIRLKFDQQGTSYVLSGIAGKADCYGVISDWYLAYWRNQNAQLTREHIEAMNTTARTKWCPAMVDAASTAILKRISTK